MSRDLAARQVPHLNQATLAAFAGVAPAVEWGESSAMLSEELITELSMADEVVIASPVYNFNTPSTLKAWADHVVRAGRTFAADEGGFRGLLGGKAACIITARGGLDPRQADCQGAFLQALFRFMGFERVEWIALEGTMADAEHLATEMERAKQEVEAWFQPAALLPDGIEWQGVFSARDRAEITALRAAQARVITKGDADGYAELCAEDITLMLQGREIVRGRAAFLECETALFRAARFRSIRQMPLRVEREGMLAVETGVSEVELEGDSAESANYRARRKYTHVLRKTEAGWRFAVLMSNNSQ